MGPGLELLAEAAGGLGVLGIIGFRVEGFREFRDFLGNVGVTFREFRV